MRIFVALLLALFTSAFITTPLHAATASGVVFLDRDHDGERGPSEPGIPNVRVSNGLDVVLTDDKGAYRIELNAPAVLFITKPADYAVPVNADQIPQFYYIHQPEGSPEHHRFPGVEPTGPLPESIDFALYNRPEPRQFEALLFADTQPQSSAEIDYIRDSVVAELIGTRARFGITLGDIMFDDLSLFPRFNRVIAQIGVPWYNVPGNHEFNFAARSSATSRETFKRYFGPPWYAFEVGDAVFVTLDNMEYAGANPDGSPGKYEGLIARRQLEWLRAELAHVPAEKLLVLAMHSPLRTYTGEPGRPGANTTNRRDLFKLLEGRPNLYSIAGHTHTMEHHYFGKEEGFAGPGTFHHHVLATVSGSWWSGPIAPSGMPVSDLRDGGAKGYHVMEVDGNAATVRYKATGKPASYQMRILFDEAFHGTRADLYRDFRPGQLYDGLLNEDAVPAARILVNFFDGGPKTTVEFSVGKSGWQPLQRVSMKDPYIVETFARHRDSVKSWVQAQNSSHMFVADLPDTLDAGIYTVNVRVTDEFGRKHHAHRALEITGSSAP